MNLVIPPAIHRPDGAQRGRIVQNRPCCRLGDQCHFSRNLLFRHRFQGIGSLLRQIARPRESLPREASVASRPGLAASAIQFSAGWVGAARIWARCGHGAARALPGDPCITRLNGLRDPCSGCRPKINVAWLSLKSIIFSTINMKSI